MTPGQEGPHDTSDDETQAWQSPVPAPRNADVPTAQATPPPPDSFPESATTVPGTTNFGHGTNTPRPDTEPETDPAFTGAEPVEDFVPGRVVFGKYLVVRPLGKGGMGAVWLVRHLGLEAERALKVIIPHIAIAPQMQARFRREARAMARFMHPNAVVVHDADMRSGGAAFIEMEYVRGVSVNKLLTPGVPMDLDWTARIVEQLCDVLQVAHKHGIVHRDLKPSNLMLLDEQGPGREHLKVLDFGIAKILGGEDHNEGVRKGEGEDLITLPGIPVGTPVYMSPEQIDAGGEGIDGRSDVYSLGVILYEFLTGFLPFKGPALRVISDHMYAPAPSFADRNPEAKVPPEVERLVLRCLEKSPARRPQSARELAEEFRRLTRPEPEPIPAQKAPPAPSRRAFWAAGLLVPGLLALAVALRFRTPPFVVRAAPAALTLRAGETATVAVLVTRSNDKGPVRFIPVEPPRGITMTREPHNGGDDAQFRLSADLNMNTNPRRTIPIAIQAEAGANRQTVKVALTVVPPAVALPSGFVRPEDALLVRVNKRIYADRITRVFPDGTLVFLLIGKERSDDPDPFFIMEDKVSNGLFARFAAENPSAVKDSKWTKGGVADGKYLTNADERLPVMNVSAKEAHAFAGWLGGRLPTCKQWDKAAGLAVEDRHGRKGPFEGTWDGHDSDQIAVGREKEGPLPVGRKTRDVSPFGCRDMAGNGLEWTRDSQTPGHTIPPADERADVFITRGRRYSERSPLTYTKLGNAALDSESFQYLDADPELGFRVVIEIDP